MNISALSSTAPLSKPNRFKISGNEEQTDFDLSLYDFNARTYDPVIGRFIQVDPLGDQRDWLTPYNFVQNNPLIRIDPNGDIDDYFDLDGNYLGSDDSNTDFVRIIDKYSWAAFADKKEDGNYTISDNAKEDLTSKLTDTELEDESIISIISHYNEQLADEDKTDREFEYTLDDYENGSIALTAVEDYVGIKGFFKLWDKTPKLNINTSNGKVAGWQMDNVGNIMSILTHEHFHFNNKSNASLEQQELSAYEFQFRHSSMRKTTNDFYNSTVNKIADLRAILGKGN